MENPNEIPRFHHFRKSPIPMAIETGDLMKVLHQFNGLETIHKWELTAFGAFLYLTGARISEALAVRNKDLLAIEGGYRLTLKTVKARIYNVRMIPVAPAKTDKPFFNLVEEYIRNINGFLEKPDDYLFSFASRFIINNLMKKIETEPILKLDYLNKRWIEEPYRMHPHYFRHCRLSHLPPLFGFGELDLMRFAGWSSTRPAVFYIKINYKDMLKKMVSADFASEYAKFLLANKEG